MDNETQDQVSLLQMTADAARRAQELVDTLEGEVRVQGGLCAELRVQLMDEERTLSTKRHELSAARETLMSLLEQSAGLAKARYETLAIKQKVS